MVGAMIGQLANSIQDTLKDILGGLDGLLDFPSPIEEPSQGGVEGLNIIDDIVSLLECDEKPGCPEVSESSLWDGGSVTPDTGLSDLQNIAKGFSGILDNLKMLDFKAPSLSFGDLFGAGGCNSGPVACGPPTVKFFGGRGSGAAGNLIIGALGEIMGIDMVDLGINYDRDANAVVIDTCGKGQGAVIRPVVVDGQITNINVVEPGTGYLSVPDGSTGGDGKVWARPEETTVTRADGEVEIPYQPGNVVTVLPNDTVLMPPGTEVVTEPLSPSDIQQIAVDANVNNLNNNLNTELGQLVDSILGTDGILSLPGVVMIEDLGLAEPNMHQAVPNMGVDVVWNDLGLDGTGAVIAVLDTGVRGDHEGLNDMDDDPFTCIDEPPDPLDPNPEPIPADCDPKIIAFFDAVFTDQELDPSESYDSGTHGTHVAGIAAGSGGGQVDPTTGEKYVGAAPGAWLINILACCDGDIEDIMQGAQWAIDNKEKYGINILTSSLGEQQFEIHVDNDGSSAWSRQMDAVVEAGIITTLSAGNEFGGATFAGCNTIDSPGDAALPVTVASLDKDLGLAIYSSRGYTSDLRVKPDVATIGSSIMAPDAATNDGYTSKSGTSMATPLMAGIAALMVQANPDITPSEFKDIIAAYSIEREIVLLDDPGFNDCSVAETRPDNEFGYGQADPIVFVEVAGSIDRSLNVTMDIDTLQVIQNQSQITGIASGLPSGSEGRVEVRVGGAEWSEAKDESDDGDWTSWSIVLEPHNNSGNTTIFARLYLDDDHISPIDAKRVILIDEVATNQEKGLNEESLLIVLFGLSLIHI